MISWMMENNRAARAAHFLMEFFHVVSQTTTWSFQIYGFNNNEAVNLSKLFEKTKWKDNVASWQYINLPQVSIFQ